jgi:hypothetical protein
MQPKIKPDAPDSPLDQDASYLKISDDGQEDLQVDALEIARGLWEKTHASAHPSPLA